MGLRRLHKVRSGIEAFPLPLYHEMLNLLKERGLDREWLLVYLLGETGMLVSEVLRLRPVDMSFDGADKKIAVVQSNDRIPKWTPRIYHKVSGSVAGAMEWWVRKNQVEKWERLFPYTKRMAQKIFRKAIKASEVKGSWGTRSLRHMYGLTVAMATDSEAAVAQALRMKGSGSARIYVRIARELTKGA
jgi:integrase